MTNVFINATAVIRIIMHIDKATKKDAPVIFHFIQLKADFDGKMRGTPFTFATTLDKIENTLFSPLPFANVFLLKEGEETLGFALYFFKYSSFSGQPSVWLDDLFINDTQRSKGGGLLLMNALIKEAKNVGAAYLFWTASLANARVQQFYKQFGAKIERIDDGLIYYRLPITID